MGYGTGVDVGSTQTKAVIIDEKRQIVGRSLIDTGANVVTAAKNAYAEALADSGLQEEQIDYIVGTGYGRYRVTFGDIQVTEISCHGRGAVHMFPATRTVVDMGGQDTKAIRVSPTGEILDFCMNDKCAAGTGRFLGAVAAAFEIPLKDLGPMALSGERPVKIATTCTVFAETEVLSWLSRGKKLEDILLGVHRSSVSRSVGLMRRVGIEPEVTFTGGVAKNVGMVAGLKDAVDLPVNVGDDSHYMGALGAALFAMDHILGSRMPAAPVEGE
ncbi:MAG: acyl-CoA dehydratase activase [Vicinamibacterales bacterium]|jgi:predicted CoA-substrate-specific enzyme activase|nr:2-hydroxyglutaryl-CoA dehydratase [Acidobacteriota bacterium]MDP6372186.1 acyl-CoA dehydratase activase [Vicinamibacterales bacterium]MDP6608305.1 acyl-CoA dehydratase activase [Vicinamibacterales bacterium]HAK56612.1 2-hydroxyglutaryl-CoA dehydratase [Acidobacteriota bacterium]|tara:strand:+ start:5466 stop:6281 length:816 start_codon:yes stop_codon:yes gene_type:complete